jgi:phage replication-related protein YjqB (UPF0714/DUF867 family)
MRMPVMADHYLGYEDLARDHIEGVDYAIHVRPAAGARVAVVAPHGGRIEGGTSDIARLIAGEEHALYLFEGLRTSGDNFERLHLTSHCFDEPRCLDLISACETVIAVHGYAAAGPDVLLGGRDEELKQRLVPALRAQGLSVQTDGHSYPGLDPRNVCNRSRSGMGVQIELSAPLRRSRAWNGLVQGIQTLLRELPDSA